MGKHELKILEQSKKIYSNYLIHTLSYESFDVFSFQSLYYHKPLRTNSCFLRLVYLFCDKECKKNDTVIHYRC